MSAPVGHNRPPGMIAVCDQVCADISAWMAEHPAISTPEDAKEAKLQLDRGKLTLKDMEDERDAAVRPLNTQVKEINESYRPTKTLVNDVLAELGKRVTAYLTAEEEKKQAAMREAARIAEEARTRALEAARRAAEAAESATTGELGVDIKAAAREAGVAAREAEKAERAAQIAEKETHVKVAGGFSRAASLRKVKVYVITDAAAAVKAIGTTPDIFEAIVKGARAYHEEWGEIPPGIMMYEERKI